MNLLKVKTGHKPQWYSRYRGQPVTLFKEAWVWCEAEEKLYKRLCVGETLHLCSGYSELGDEKLDVNPEVRPSVVADVHYLPFHDLSFDTVICDPPWYGPRSWMKWETMMKEMVRVSRRRIILVLGNLFYLLPKPFHLKAAYIVKKISPQVKLVYVWEREPDLRGWSSK